MFCTGTTVQNLTGDALVPMVPRNVCTYLLACSSIGNTAANMMLMEKKTKHVYKNSKSLQDMDNVTKPPKTPPFFPLLSFVHVFIYTEGSGMVNNFRSTFFLGSLLENISLFANMGISHATKKSPFQDPECIHAHDKPHIILHFILYLWFLVICLELCLVEST